MNIPDNEQEFIDFYRRFEPKGAGDIGMMKIIQSLMREIAHYRGYKLEK